MDDSILPEKLMRAGEVASILGVSKMQVYRLVKLGDLHAVIFGKSIRVRPSELALFINHHSTTTKGDDSTHYQKTIEAERVDKNDCNKPPQS
jgi:excisionase family DNA binding protein